MMEVVIADTTNIKPITYEYSGDRGLRL